MIEKYTKLFSKLRTDKNRNRYPAFTTHRAPHKPFLLLSVMDLIAQGQITENFIKPTFELVDTFNTYYNSIMPLGSKTTMAYPYFHLKSEGFWHRIPNPGYEDKLGIPVFSMTKVREFYAGAKLDDELFQLICGSDTREQLRAALISTYFVEEIRVKGDVHKKLILEKKAPFFKRQSIRID
ncbi:hypothetical protein ACFL9T_20120, partial [Thermodesulfobacteriota bacterium]